MNKYHINIFYSKEDGCYVADIPDLKTCSAFGDTPEEALKEVQVAVAGWIEAAQRIGKPIPRPRYRPLIYQAMVSDLQPRSAKRRSRTTSARRKVPVA